LVGEIQDEYDNETPFVEKTGDKTYSVLASATLDDVNDLLPHEIEKDEAFNTLAGYLIHKFGKIPSVNEKISVDNYEFTILKKTRTTITHVKMVDLTD
jgi:CBS domain containing-hemolysin-like protein